MFSANPEQINVFKSNIDAFMTLSKIALSSTERLAALNLSTARAALDDGGAASNALVRIKDVKELAALPSPLSGPAMEKTVAYLRNVQEIAAEAQAEISKLMNSYLSTLGKASTASAGWASGFDMFKKVAQQMTGMAEANIKAVGDTTAQMSATVTPHSRKAA